MAKAKTSITTENRSGSAADAAAKEQRTEMPLSDLHPFEGHPFKVLDDELMEQTVESIKQIGVVSPLIVRPDPEGGFEILSGHRRLHAAQLAGLETVPVIVKEMDDDAAIIFMVDSNLQRENILPSERAFSYKMKLEAMKHQGQRGDLTSDQVGQKSWAVNQLADDANESKTQVQRFIRLTNLIREILDMVDEKKIAFNPAVELSYLKPSEQKEFLEAIKGFQSDIRTVAAHPLPEEGFCGMAVNGTCFTEKVEAGEAILAICKANQSLEPVPLGSYRGFKMELTFDSFQKEYQVLLKGEMTHRVPIGTSAAGNIQRLDNALAGIPARLEKAEQQLDNLRSQQEAAQAELGKPFPQEAELAEKSVRLAELDALLNMDDRGNDDPDRERTTEKPSVLAELRDRAGRIPPMTHRDDEEVAL